MPAAAVTVSPANAERTPPRTASLTSNAAGLAFGSLFTQAAQILTLSVLARLVAKDEIATYQQMNLVYGVLSPLLLAGIPAALLYFVPRAALPEERHAWMVRAYVVLGCTGLVASLTVVAARDALASLFNNPGLASALAWYAPYLFFAFVAAVAPPALVASGRARSAALLNALVGASTMACVVLAALISPTGDGLAKALSVSGAILAVASVLIVRRTTGVRSGSARERSGRGRQILAYGLPLAVTGLAGTLGYQFDRIVVSVNFAPHDFAIYALGAVEVPIGILIAAAVSNVLVPRLTILWRDSDRRAMVALWREAMRKTSLILLPLFAFMMAMSADLVRLLYGSGYSESVEVFRVYLFLLPLRITTWGLIPQAIGRTRINLWASAILLVANAGIAVALVGPLGLIGPALAAPIASVAAATYYVVRLRSIAGLTVRDLIPIRALAGTLAVSLLAAAPLLAVREVPVPVLVRVLAAAALYGLVAPLGLRAARRITDDDWMRLRDAIAVHLRHARV